MYYILILKYFVYFCLIIPFGRDSLICMYLHEEAGSKYKKCIKLLCGRWKLADGARGGCESLHCVNLLILSNF